MSSTFDSGNGSKLPTVVLLTAGISTIVAVLVSAMSIHLQLKNYRKPILQRMVVRIMIMVPIYGTASLISLFSVEAASVIDVIRDVYEAFVIYCFFVLLLAYLGGERSLLILLHGRPPKAPVFPINIFKREIDVSDPYTFLFLKRGILQYVQIKPLLAAATLILKAFGVFNEGNFRANSGYLYISIIYNASICLSLYCLAMFWVCVHDDLKPFRPMPKFLCVKGILFFSFWQSVGISILVAARVITKFGPYTDPEKVSVGINDTLICLEMPFFAIAHMYAFSYRDYINARHTFVARMPMYYAFRDAFGLLDVVEDSKATLRGEGMDYREFEPAEGFMHQGLGRDRRIRAGLRYSKGGQRKYWLPKTTEDSQPPGRTERTINYTINKIAGGSADDGIHAPLLADEAEDVVHLAPDLQDPNDENTVWGDADIEDGFELPFGDLDDNDEELFAHSTKYLFGDYNYPCIDVSTEHARMMVWDEEERVLNDERGAWFSPIRGAKGQAALQQRDQPAWIGYGAVNTARPSDGKGRSSRLHEEFPQDHAKVIDLAQDQVAPDQKDIRMKWTKVRGDHGSPSTSHPQSPHVQYRGLLTGASPGSSSGSSSYNNNGLRSPPSMSRKPSKRSGLAILPPDAVDLVIEDGHVSDEEQIQERNTGEIRSSGLRKVYQGGSVVDMEDEQEVEVGEHGSEEHGKADKEEPLTDAPEHGEAYRGDDVYLPGLAQQSDPIIARAVTPPLHVRVERYDYHISDNDNPWA